MVNSIKYSTTDRYDDGTAEVIADFTKERHSLHAVIRRLEGNILPSKDGTFSRTGLERLVLDAQRHFESVTGIRLPSNLENGGPYADFPFRSRTNSPRTEEIIEETARFSGWLRYIANNASDLRHALVFIKKTQGRRRGSKDTHADLWAVARAYPNPHKFDSLVKRTLWHANLLCGSFGLRPAWQVLGSVLSPIRRGSELKATYSPRRAAMKITLGTLKLVTRRCDTYGFSLASFNGFRQWMQSPAWIKQSAIDDVREGRAKSLKEALSHQGDLVSETVDGVVVYSDVSRHFRRRGFEVRPGYDEEGQKVTVYKRNLRVYHQYGHPLPDSDLGIQAAISAFRRQDGVLASFEYDRGNFCPLVYLEDSWEAGNCIPGTDAWTKRMGLRGKFIPLEALLRADPNNQRVINTASVGMERFRDWVEMHL